METEFALSLGTQRWALPAESDTITIGRASNADVRLQADDQISRIHARLGRTGTTWTLYDESRNGTGLNGRRLAAPTPLTEGDRIHIGRSVLTFHETPIAAPAPDPGSARPDPGAAASAPAAPSPTSAPPTHLSAPDSSTPPQPAAIPGTPQPPAATPDTRSPVTPAPEDASPFIPADLTSPRPTPPADTNRPSPFTPADPESEPSRFTPASEPGPYTPAEHAPEPSPFTPASEPGQYTPADPASEHSPFTSASEPGPYAPEEQAAGPSPFAPAEAEAGPFGSAESGSLDDSVPPPASPDIPRRADAPGNFPLFADEPSYQGTDEDAPWAAYPSADNPEPARSPWDLNNPPAAQIDSQPHWNEPAGWPDTSRANQPDHSQPERRQPDRRPPTDRVRSDDDGSEEVGTVRLLRVLLIAGAVIALGLVINLIVTFLADGPGSALRWFVPPAIALVLAMIIALLDAAAPTGRAPGRLDVSIVIAIVVVLLGVGVGGFALTAGAEYVGGYLTGNESGEDRLIKPVAKPGDGLTVTVQNVTYTSHFTRVELLVKNTGQQAVRLPLDGNATFTGAEGNALRADASRSQWPDSIPAGGSEHGTITFTGHLPDATTAAVLTLKSGDTDVAISGINLSK